MILFNGRKREAKIREGRMATTAGGRALMLLVVMLVTGAGDGGVLLGGKVA